MLTENFQVSRKPDTEVFNFNLKNFNAFECGGNILLVI